MEPRVRCEDKIVMIPVSDLTPHPQNRNKHPKKQLEHMAKIIEYQGWRYPIKVSNQSGFITTGNGRYLMAKMKKWEKVPVSFQDYDDSDQEYADVVADNAIAEWSLLNVADIRKDLESLPNLDQDLLGLKELLTPEKKGNTDQDSVPAVKDNPMGVEPGDVFELGDHRLLCGDATKIEDYDKLLDGEQIDLVVTDPPYNVDYEGSTGLKIENDKMDDNSFFQFLYDSFSSLCAHAKSGSPIYIFHADSEGLNFRAAMVKAGWLMKQCCVWVKSSLVMGRQDYHWQHEPVLYGWKPGAAHVWESDRKQTTVWKFEKPKANKDHPTMKPVDLIKYPITNSSAERSVVVDPFGGSGSTLIACEQLNRRCFTMELDPHYCSVIIKRWEEFTGEEAKKLNA